MKAQKSILKVLLLSENLGHLLQTQMLLVYNKHSALIRQCQKSVGLAISILLEGLYLNTHVMTAVGDSDVSCQLSLIKPSSDTVNVYIHYAAKYCIHFIFIFLCN